MNYSKYHLWLYTKLNSPNPLPPLGVYTCSRGGEGEGEKKFCWGGWQYARKNTELMVLAQNHHKSRFGSQLEIIEKLGICHV